MPSLRTPSEQLAAVTRERDEALAKLAPMPCGHPAYAQHREMHRAARPYCTTCRMLREYRELEEENQALEQENETLKRELGEARDGSK